MKNVISQRWSKKETYKNTEDFRNSLHLNMDDIIEFHNHFPEYVRQGEPKVKKVSDKTFEIIKNAPFGGTWE